MHGFVAYPRRELEAAWSQRPVQFLNDPRVHSSSMCSPASAMLLSSGRRPRMP